MVLHGSHPTLATTIITTTPTPTPTPRFFEWLSIAHPHNNVHNMRLCRLVADAKVLPAAALVQLEAVDRVRAGRLPLCSHAHARGVGREEARAGWRQLLPQALLEWLLVCVARATSRGAMHGARLWRAGSPAQGRGQGRALAGSVTALALAAQWHASAPGRLQLLLQAPEQPKGTSPAAVCCPPAGAGGAGVCA